MEDIINAYNLSQNTITLPSIAALQNNITLTGGYVYINDVGFYYGDPALTGLAGKSDNSIIVDKNGTRWIFQPQLIPNLNSTNNFPAGITVPAGQTINNLGTYTGTPVLTSIINGGRLSVTNPTSPGPATLGVTTNIAFQGQQATTVSTTSTSWVFTGTGVIFTPNYTGNVKISLSAQVGNDTIGDGTKVNLVYAQGNTLNAGGTAATGTFLLNPSITATIASSGDIKGISLINCILTGLTVDISYTFQPIFTILNGGTASFLQINITVEEY